MGKASRDKGKRGEREARDRVRELWRCPVCTRTAQVSGKFSSDLMGGPVGLHIEVKRYKSIAACRFIEQAVDDSLSSEVPTVLMREDSGEWMVMVRMEDAENFARALIAHMEGETH